MKTSLLISMLCGALLLSGAAMAVSLPGPELGKLSNLTFGWVSMSGVDPTLDMLTSFAPTTMALRDAGYRSGGEVVTGSMNFSELDVTSNFQSAMTSAGPGVLRICQYTYDSNLARLVGIENLSDTMVPDLPVRTSGEAIELSYAQHTQYGTVGISVVPKDESRIAMVADGTEILKSASETDYGVRVGVVRKLAGDVKVGANYSYQRDHGVTEIMLMPTMTKGEGRDVVEPMWHQVEGDYITRCATVGASKQFGAATTGYVAYQNILATGTNMHRKADLVWFGVQRDVAKNLAVRVNYLDGGQNYSVQWRSPIGILNVAYTHRALMNAREILGTGEAAFAALAVAF